MSTSREAADDAGGGDREVALAFLRLKSVAPPELSVKLTLSAVMRVTAVPPLPVRSKAKLPREGLLEDRRARAVPAIAMRWVAAWRVTSSL